MDQEHERYQEWTSCEFYGHLFEDGHCADCGEKEDEESAEENKSDDQE